MPKPKRPKKTIPSVSLYKMVWRNYGESGERENLFTQEDANLNHISWVYKLYTEGYEEKDEVHKVMEGCRERWSRKFKVFLLEEKLKH